MIKRPRTIPAPSDAWRGGYVIHKGRGEPVKFWDWCHRNERPYAWARTYRLYARVDMDMDPSFRHFTDEGVEAVRRVWLSIPGIPRSSEASLGTSWITFYKVPIGEAENTLVRLLDLAKDPAMTRDAFGGPGQFLADRSS